MPSPFTDTQLYEEYTKLTSFELCVHAQEITQDAITKIIEFINYLKATSTISLLGDQNSYIQRKLRFEETLNSFEVIFQRLRIVGDLVHRQKLNIDKKSTEELEQSKANAQVLKIELDELKVQLKEKNSYLKLAIDKVTEIIWQINSMQKLRQ